MDPISADLDAAATLAAAETVLTERRAAQVRDLLLVAHWADLHAGDPQAEPGAAPVSHGGDRLVRLGGDGTPGVQELCVAELAIARHTSVAATRAALADVLDLRHRLPHVWALLLELACEPWVAAKVARISRALDRDQVRAVDAAVAAAIAGQSPGRVIAIAEAKTIEADTAAHAARLDQARRQRGVWVGRTDLETGTRGVFARLEPGDAVWVDATVERIADALAARPDLLRAHHPDLPADLDDLTRDELRAVAFGWLARPDDVHDLLAAPESTAEALPRRPHHRAVVYLHLHDTLLTDPTAGVARGEGLGPLLVEQVTRLLGHAQVTLKPVVDLAEQQRVNAYEHPTRVSERTRLRCVGDAFPYATSTATLSGRYDDDHPTPYDPGGPPGQTGDHNDAPLTRGHHRAKTHAGYTVRQLDDATYLWTTPHGLTRLVDPTGTHDLSEGDVRALNAADALDRALERIARAFPG